jgi:hypothetical protein
MRTANRGASGRTRKRAAACRQPDPGDRDVEEAVTRPRVGGTRKAIGRPLCRPSDGHDLLQSRDSRLGSSCGQAGWGLARFDGTCRSYKVGRGLIGREVPPRGRQAAPSAALVGNHCEPITESSASPWASCEPGGAVNTTSRSVRVLGGEDLAVKRERADVRVEKALQRAVGDGAAGDLVALPQRREFVALPQQMLDQLARLWVVARAALARPAATRHSRGSAAGDPPLGGCGARPGR